MNPILRRIILAFVLSCPCVLHAVTGEATTGNVTVDTRMAFLTLQATTGGEISGASSSYTIGTNATLTATPALGYVFSGWTGDASGTENSLTLTMDIDKTVGASFAQDTRDTDTDGLSNYLEAVVYGTSTTSSDSDGDGLSDAWEVGIGRFSIVTGSFTWAQARANAQSRGGALASFPTQESWDRMLDNLGALAFEDFTGLWIGASDATQEGTWTWVNGATFSFSEWASTRPSAVIGNSLDYAEVSGGAGAELLKWYDRSATTIRDGYLLEVGRTTSPTVADADGDGLNDGQEQSANTNPLVADTDGDGLKDGDEINLTQTNPLSADSDGDTISDANEDIDADGLSNLLEVNTHGTNPLMADSDGDSYSDSYEVSNSSNPLDGDSLPTYQLTLSSGGVVTGGSFEYTGNLAHGTNATLTATPATGYVFSGWSGNASGTDNPLTLLMNGNKTVGAAFAQDSRDSDGDGLTNYQELIDHGTNPNLADSNDDGLQDGLALDLGKNPNEDHSAFVQTILTKRALLGLRSDSDYTDLRAGSMSVQRAAGSNKLQIRMKLQKSTNLLNWQDDGEAVFEADVEPTSPKLFYRFGVE
jgi:uncharacterized repeat protein (TIGR02543 family)